MMFLPPVLKRLLRQQAHTLPLHGIDPPIPCVVKLYQRIDEDWRAVSTIATAESVEEAAEKRTLYLFWAYEAECELTSVGNGVWAFANPEQDVYSEIRIEAVIGGMDQ